MSLFSRKLSDAATELVDAKKRRAAQAEKFYRLLSKQMKKEDGVRRIMEAIRLSDTRSDKHYLRVCECADIGSNHDLGLTSKGFVFLKYGSEPIKLRARHFLTDKDLSLKERTATLEASLLGCVDDFRTKLRLICADEGFECFEVTGLLACLPCLCIAASAAVIKGDVAFLD